MPKKSILNDFGVALAFLFLTQVFIEGHTNGTNQQAPFGQHGHRLLSERQQTFFFVIPQQFDFFFEVTLEVDQVSDFQ